MLLIVDGVTYLQEPWHGVGQELQESGGHFGIMLTSAKSACHCQSPVQVLATQWSLCAVGAKALITVRTWRPLQS